MTIQESSVKIFLDSVEVALRIGIYPHEEERPQRALVDVELYADPALYLKGVNKDTIIDYAVFYNAIISWADRPQVRLIEDYLKELVELCFVHEMVTACRVGIKKADVFGENQGAAIEVFMNRSDFD